MADTLWHDVASDQAYAKDEDHTGCSDDRPKQGDVHGRQGYLIVVVSVLGCRAHGRGAAVGGQVRSDKTLVVHLCLLIRVHLTHLGTQIARALSCRRMTPFTECRCWRRAVAMAEAGRVGNNWCQ